MNHFIVTNKAKSDLIDIARYTQKNWGINRRNSYLKQFDDSFHSLAREPMIGICCEYIKAGYRKFPQGSHIIYYRQNESQSIEIIRVLHKSMDVNRNI
ncbi:type II toxin-antitoxin system RelE/ParE family toxin [Photobacterium profundum]|uniref:Toxin n=1 Tax=Photobacterium profundum (strain SS9) TaxID=298386 RepID=Q6LI15_PHOPR|nr:type II toxin-antitoxin system RelE/ParE family toxin [Photobacterium profundum]CAG23065.1 putative Plasmid stabilization element ParE [Photobacterium profundum SS9]